MNQLNLNFRTPIISYLGNFISFLIIIGLHASPLPVLAQVNPSAIIEKFKIKSPIDKSKIYHYQAIKLHEANKPEKAIKKLKKANRLYRDNQYFIDLAEIYAGQGKTKKAFNEIKKILVKDESTDIQKVELCAWKAYYGLSNGINKGV